MDLAAGACFPEVESWVTLAEASDGPDEDCDLVTDDAGAAVS